MPIAAAITGASGILGAGINYKAQKEANETNLKIAQMNNEWNEKMLQKQMDYNTEMWNKENEYNTAANQAKRLQEAGINPGMALGNVNAGIAGSAGGVTPPTAQGVQVQAPQFDMNSVIGLVQSAMMQKEQMAKIRAEREQINIDNQTRMQKNIAELNRQIAETRSTRLKNVYQDIQNKWADQLNAEGLKLLQNQNMGVVADTGLKIMQGMTLAKEFQYIDAHKQYELSKLAGEIALLRSQKKLTDKQARTEIWRATETMYQSAKTRAERDTIDALRKYLVDKAEAEAINAIVNQVSPGGAVGPVIPFVQMFSGSTEENLKKKGYE